MAAGDTNNGVDGVENIDNGINTKDGVELLVKTPAMAAMT